jgi:ribosome modulation factor
LILVNWRCHVTGFEQSVYDIHLNITPSQETKINNIHYTLAVLYDFSKLVPRFPWLTGWRGKWSWNEPVGSGLMSSHEQRKSILIGWRQTLTTSPPNHIPALFARSPNF